MPIEISFNKDHAYHFWQVSVIHRIEKKKDYNYIIVKREEKNGTIMNMRSIDKPFEKINWDFYIDTLIDQVVIFIPSELGNAINEKICTDRANGHGTEFILMCHDVQDKEGLVTAKAVAYKEDEIPVEV